MGAALILPVVVFVMLGIVWVFFVAGKHSRARRAAATLPDEPYARRDEELRRLRTDHAESDPSLVTHPERRP
jgi:hypothetical protein